jgi:hypothetical protein
LSKLADEHPGTVAGRTAQFIIARMKFQDGQASLLAPSRRAESAKELRAAIELYEKLAGQCSEFPVLEQECWLAIAKGEEDLAHVNDPEHPETTLGSLEKALAAHRKLATKYPDSPPGKQAAERVERLESPDERVKIDKFYTELAQLAKPVTTLDSKVPPPGAPPAPKP